jgi:hypothetical protein
MSKESLLHPKYSLRIRIPCRSFSLLRGLAPIQPLSQIARLTPSEGIEIVRRTVLLGSKGKFNSRPISQTSSTNKENSRRTLSYSIIASRLTIVMLKCKRLLQNIRRHHQDFHKIDKLEL